MLLCLSRSWSLFVSGFCCDDWYRGGMSVRMLSLKGNCIIGSAWSLYSTKSPSNSHSIIEFREWFIELHIKARSHYANHRLAFVQQSKPVGLSWRSIHTQRHAGFCIFLKDSSTHAILYPHAILTRLSDLLPDCQIHDRNALDCCYHRHPHYFSCTFDAAQADVATIVVVWHRQVYTTSSEMSVLLQVPKDWNNNQVYATVVQCSCVLINCCASHSLVRPEHNSHYAFLIVKLQDR